MSLQLLPHCFFSFVELTLQVYDNQIVDDIISDDTDQLQRLMEFIAAEDAALGEVGCGHVGGDKLSVYLENRGININEEYWKNLLREHLGHVLTEHDFDSIISQVARYVESFVMGVVVPFQAHDIKLRDTLN